MAFAKKTDTFSHLKKKIVILYRLYRPIVLSFVTVLVIVGTSFLYWAFSVGYFNRTPIYRIEPKEISIQQGSFAKIKIYFDPDGKYGKYPEEEATSKAVWSEDNASIAYVGRIAPTSGMVYAVKAGTTTVSAAFGDNVASAEIYITQPASSSIACNPVLGSGTTASIGEPVAYIAAYRNKISPNFKYIWTAPEGQQSSEMMPKFVFKKPGEVIVRVAIITNEGGPAVKTNCSSLTVTNK